MRSIHGRKRWASLATMVGAAAAAVFQLLTVPVFAGFELPAGERITNLPAIPRNMPQKEGYEAYDPAIGRNFDIKNFWMRADLRVRPEMRNNTCFGGAILAGGACNTFGGANARGVAPNQNNNGNKGNDFFVQQWIRLGIGYDLSPDVNFYMEIIDSATWGGNGNALNAGNGGDPLNHNCSSTAQGACRLGVRAAYVLVRNLAGVQGLSMKAGRQYVIFGNHSLFGHFDWANTGYSHDGVMFAYQTKTFDSYLGWFRNSETDIPQAAPVGSGGPNIAGTGGRDANRDADMIIFYNQYKGLPGFMVEPYFVYYKNNLGAADNIAQGLGTAKHSNQTRYMVGGRVEMRKGGWDFSSETAWQFGQMGQAGACSGEQKCLSINAWATRNWVGYTAYDFKWKPRLAFNFDYASGDGRNNTCGPTPGSCSTANTFENFFPTNHIHMGYMDIQAWKNMLSPSVNFQARPSERDHIEIWYTNLNLASSKDCWYRGAQGCYVFSNANNTKTHIGDEIDFTWTRMFADGKVAFQATYGTLFTGGYLTSTLNQTQNQHWAYLSLWMNF